MLLMLFECLVKPKAELFLDQGLVSLNLGQS